MLEKGKPPARVSLLHFVQFTRRSLCNKLQKLLATSPAHWEGKREFRSLRRATKGAAFGIRHPLKRVDRNFIIWCKIQSMVKNGRTQFAPTVWDFHQWLKICTPTNASLA